MYIERSRIERASERESEKDQKFEKNKFFDKKKSCCNFSAILKN